jgi:hypothetical protein
MNVFLLHGENMKNFFQWAKENKKELPISEDKLRTGIHTAMPTGYVRHEYPDAYFYAHSATAALDLQNLKAKVKDKAPPNDAP